MAIQGNGQLYEEITTGTYSSDLREKYYKITIEEPGTIFFQPVFFSGAGPYIYNMDFEYIGEMSAPLDHFEAGEYYIQTKYSSPTSAEASLYIPSEQSYESLPELRTGNYPENNYNNFYSLSIAQDGNISLSPSGDSATFKLYDKNLNLILDGYGVNGPIHVEKGDYILHTSYNASPSRTSLNAYIPDELFTPQNTEDEVTDYSVNDVQSLYVGLLGRSADPAGLQYWSNQLDSGTISLEQLRANIVNEQPEYLSGIGSQSRSEAVSSIYENLFNRPPEAEGQSYWVTGGGKDVNFDQLVLALINGASEEDTTALSNRVEVANTFTEASKQTDGFNISSASIALENVGGNSEGLDAANSRAIDLASGVIGPDATTPPAADWVGVSSSFAGVSVTWDVPEWFNELDSSYIYRSASPDPSTAQLVGVDNGRFFTDDDPVVFEKPHYYWVSLVSKAGLEGPLEGAYDGEAEQAIPSIDDTITSISEEINDSNLSKELEEPIDRIELDTLGISDSAYFDIA